MQLAPEDVVSCLSNFLENRGGPYDWDDFISVDIADPALEAIRAAAANIDLPVNADGERRIRDLLTEARQVAHERSAV
ncbi:hypothetical protein [Brevundimonas sp.]|uniref:hypothetical protein n=1 Tax=Brevundimonas sp. TaxID=1871086 RepID=UPI00289D3B7C|nr:hypothetical protein [Brevundimonas sp.]